MGPFPIPPPHPEIFLPLRVASFVPSARAKSHADHRASPPPACAAPQEFERSRLCVRAVMHKLRQSSRDLIAPPTGVFARVLHQKAPHRLRRQTDLLPSLQ